MKRYLIAFFLIFSLSAFSQNFEGFKGYVITNNHDTIHGTFDAISNIFYKNIFNPARVRKVVKINNNAGIVTKYKPNEILSFLVYKPRGEKDYKFISTYRDNYKRFYHEIAVGEISYYKIYDQDMNASEIYDEIFIKNDNIQEVTMFSYRKDLGELIKDYPELYSKWIDGNKFYKTHETELVISLYNEYFKNK